MEFLKTTLIGGFFILLPLLLLELMMVEVFGLVVALSAPLADLVPGALVEAINAPVAVALVLVVLASLILGLAARSEAGRRLGQWIERNTLGRLALYGVLKGLAARLVEIGEGSTFKPAMLVSGDGQREFAYLIEDHGDGRVTIMLPWAPTPLSGSVKIVRKEQIELLDATLGDVTRVLSHWGVGARSLLRPGARS
ncbi:MAG: hypothetical protein JSU71_11320 [Betaproteobacteria bacterium]|nr:MAG: hypothetical protein JSU71_11320 [Betaproteobacteria bacterium]